MSDTAALRNGQIPAEDSETPDTVHELYAGDTGTLPAATRQVLVHLLKGPYFERSRSAKLWDELRRSETVIRSRLSDLYLDLFIDDGLGIAFCRRPDLGDHTAPSLLNTVRLRFLDSAMLLELRSKLMQAKSRGERAVITKTEFRDLLRVYDTRAQQDDPLLERHLAGILARFTERKFLLTLKSEDAMEVSPVLPLLFPAAALDELRATYVRRVLREASSPEEHARLLEKLGDAAAGVEETPEAPAAVEDSDDAADEEDAMDETAADENDGEAR
ncbi:DUF4194 domain-containing protein [Sutterella sp.]|uniref:DUF4194 domain-containing protein n=1 Tax=Sutterella sp. TaxID=1981025 RepID=UPI0026DEC4D8|nr:DUF4194 domain-containing protein [Sutterella sp.]MDO5532461.1 DUF4194 domain-containing protein [Sutterella sp.]